MERIVRPVRAWAEYDEWLVFLDREIEKCYAIPQSVNGSAFTSDAPSVTRTISALAAMMPGIGNLKALRVLYENYAQLYLWRPRSKAEGGNGLWSWELDVLGYQKDRWPSGEFPEDRDSEAVERAMIAAAAFFTQADMELVT